MGHLEVLYICEEFRVNYSLDACRTDMPVASGCGSARINISYNGQKRVCIYDRVIINFNQRWKLHVTVTTQLQAVGMMFTEAKKLQEAGQSACLPTLQFTFQQISQQGGVSLVLYSSHIQLTKVASLVQAGLHTQGLLHASYIQ